MTAAPAERAVRVFLVAGEHSGDRLGGKLLAALRARLGARLELAGVGGEDMEAEGLHPLFPMADVAVMGFLDVGKRLPTIYRRVHQTVAAALAFAPDVVVIIDSPDFTHPIAHRIKKRRPDLPVVDYVSPTVWAWRPGRARAMARYVDHVLALLPFEPAAHARLGGPACTYVGHPIVERLGWIGSRDAAGLAARLKLRPDRPVLTVLPGSRRGEVQRLMPVFGAALGLLEKQAGPFELLLPTVPTVAGQVRQLARDWPVQPRLLEGEDDKFAAFRLSRLALAASGTVTLELGAAGTPMVVGYRVEGMAGWVRRLITAHSVVLANLVIGRNVFPELLQDDCTPERLAEAMAELLPDGPARAAQLAGLAEIPGRLAPPASSPSEAAAEIVLRLASGGAPVR